MSANEGFISYHPKPSKHMVMDAATWERIRTESKPYDIGFDHLIGPSRPAWIGTPVYIDSCQWDCAEGLIAHTEPNR